MGTFSAVGVSPDFFVVPGNSLLVTITNTFVATVVIERRLSGAYVPLYTITGDQVVALPTDGTFRLNCTGYTSGTVTYALASQAPANPYLPPGGTTGQALEKTSSAAGVADWETVTSGGLFGGKTIVVSTTGNDTAGAASPYTAEFKTIAAALAHAATNDCIIVRPGSYSPAAALVPPNGVPIFFLPGTTVNGLAESPIFSDGGVARGIRIHGEGVFKPGSGGGFVALSDGSDFYADGMKIYAPTAGTGTLGLISLTGTVASNVRVTMRDITCANNMLNCASDETENVVVVADTFDVSKKLVNITAGAHNVVVESPDSILGAQILVDSGSTGATRVSITAPTITATADDSAFSAQHSAAARYDIEADVCVGCATAYGAAIEMHSRIKSHTSQRNGSAPWVVGNGASIFLETEETIAKAGSNQAAVAIDAGAANATVHLLGGRFVGDGTGEAMKLYGSNVKPRVYPGAVLIGGSGATESIGISGVITPTVVAMGAIATNLAANVGVTIAVGSLLVDAAVV